MGNSQRMQRYEVGEEDQKEEDDEHTNIEWMAQNEDLNRKIKGVHGTPAQRARKLAKITAVISRGIGGNVPG